MEIELALILKASFSSKETLIKEMKVLEKF